MQLAKKSNTLYKKKEYSDLIFQYGYHAKNKQLLTKL